MLAKSEGSVPGLHTTQKEATGLSVRGDTLKKCERVADAIRSSSRQLGGVKERID